jgi:hypothetical protein
MIAAFLKNVDGDFDYPTALFSAFLIFAISGTAWGLYRALKTGRILFAWGSTFGGSGQFYVEREKNSTGFWVVVALYCLAISLLCFLTVGICFALFRKPV